MLNTLLMLCLKRFDKDNLNIKKEDPNSES